MRTVILILLLAITGCGGKKFVAPHLGDDIQSFPHELMFEDKTMLKYWVERNYRVYYVTTDKDGKITSVYLKGQ